MEYLTKEESLKYKNIEEETFKLEIFNDDYSFFPDNPFKNNFDCYLFLEFNSFFYENKNIYKNLIAFLKEIGVYSFYVSATGNVRSELHTIRIDLNDDIDDYYRMLYSTFDEKLEKKIEDGGIYLHSNEVLQYVENKEVVMVHDRVHDLIIIGLDKKAETAFKKYFPEAMTLEILVKRMKEGTIINIGEQGIEKLKNNYK